jgi:hypothetical protein
MNFNQDGPQNLKGFLKTMPIIYAALLIGQLLFSVVVWSIARNPVFKLKPGNDIFFYLVPLFVLSTMLVGTMIYNRRIAGLGSALTLRERITGYQTTFIIRCALSEGATLFAIVAFLQAENLYYLFFAGANILYFLTLRPTRQKMEEILSLTYEEKLES